MLDKIKEKQDGCGHDKGWHKYQITERGCHQNDYVKPRLWPSELWSVQSVCQWENQANSLGREED